MARYTHEHLGPIQRLRARWRSLRLVATRALELQEAGVPRKAAMRQAQDEHNRRVDQIRAWPR